MEAETMLEPLSRLFKEIREKGALVTRAVLAAEKMLVGKPKEYINGFEAGARWRIRLFNDLKDIKSKRG